MHPVSSACRRFLMTMRDVGHYVVMTAALRQEWRSHLSGWSRKWLTQMYARRRVHSCEAPRDVSLRRRAAAAVPGHRGPAVEKDVHLIEAALKADRLVASRDETARGLFRDASIRVRELQQIVWINPTLPADAPIGWLENGAPSEARRFGEFRQTTAYG